MGEGGIQKHTYDKVHEQTRISTYRQAKSLCYGLVMEFFLEAVCNTALFSVHSVCVSVCLSVCVCMYIAISRPFLGRFAPKLLSGLMRLTRRCKFFRFLIFDL